MEQSQFDSTTLEVEHDGETHEVDVTYSTWVARCEDGESCVNFEIYRIDCDADIPEVVVGAALADLLSVPFADEIC